MLAKQKWNAASVTKRTEIIEECGLTYTNPHSWAALSGRERKRLREHLEGCDVSEHDLHNEDNAATYCPEDNKLRLYVDGGEGRVERETYNALVKAKFKATPKQNCSFVATWSIAAEDLILALIPEWDDIGDEDYSPQERAADRAERFAGYRDKRSSEAHGHADSFESAPSAVGHQSQKRADREARKINRMRDKAVTQWEKAEYWQSRTAGVISSALYKSSPSARRGRILEIEKSIRKIEASYTPRKGSQNEYTDEDGVKMVYVGSGRGGWWRPESSLEAVKESYARVIDHLNRRLAYELQMIGDEGGLAGEVEMVPGGFVKTEQGKWVQIQKVNKSPATRRVTSVGVLGYRWYDKNRGPDNPPYNVTIKVGRSSEGIYREPTAEELEEFKSFSKQRKSKVKANKTAGPKLLNPTNEDAEKLQSLWNAEAQAKIDKANGKSSIDLYSCEPQTVRYMTQEQYKARSAGTYAHCKTKFVQENGLVFWEHYDRSTNGTRVFKVRQCPSQGSRLNDASRVIVITDKKQHPLPWNAMQEIVDAKSKETTTEKATA